jgi:hypothetical protein
MGNCISLHGMDVECRIETTMYHHTPEDFRISKHAVRSRLFLRNQEHQRRIILRHHSHCDDDLMSGKWRGIGMLFQVLLTF